MKWVLIILFLFFVGPTAVRMQSAQALDCSNPAKLSKLQIVDCHTDFGAEIAGSSLIALAIYAPIALLHKLSVRMQRKKSVVVDHGERSEDLK